MTELLRLTTARWCNRPAPKEDNPEYQAKVHCHTGPFSQYAYGTDTPFETPGNLFGYHPDDGDGPLQGSVICAPQTFVPGDDIDNPAAFAVSQTGKVLSRDDAWCTRGDGWHAPLDARGLDISAVKQGPAGWGDIKWKGFLPLPGSTHYSGQPYAPAPNVTVTGSWGDLRVTGLPAGDRAVEIMAANMADRAAFAEAKKAAREAARAAAESGSAPAAVAKAARAAAVSCWHGQDATGTHREMLLEILWECGTAHMTEEQAYAEWQKYAAPWDATRPWTDAHFHNMWDDVPRKVAEMEAEHAAEAAELPPYYAYDVENAATAGHRLRHELGTGYLAGLYLRDGQLVFTPRIGEDGYINPTPQEQARGIHHGPAQVRPVDAGRLRSLVEVKFTVFKPKRDKKTKAVTGWSPSLFPPDAARHALAAAELGIGCPNLKHLAGITHTPVMRADGTVLATPGYDAGTGLLYLLPEGLTVPEIPAKPTDQQVRKAVETILEPVALFPFVSEHHRANWLGAMFTPLLRLKVPAPWPLVIITATNAGSGKTKLARMLGIVHGMVTRGQFPGEREELRKTFLSVLHTTTAPVVLFDNVRGTVYSAELEFLLTTREVTDRELGFSRDITVANDRLWTVTGNNARIGGDLARRVLPVALDPQCAAPWTRLFTFDPAAWMTSHRGEYIAALLTVALGWVQSGEELPAATRSDDYAQWYATLRGLLAYAGNYAEIKGEFGAEVAGDMSRISEDDDEWGTFVLHLVLVFGTGSFTAKDITDKLSDEFYGPTMGANRAPTPLADALPGDLADKWGQQRFTRTTGFTKSLGKWLAYRDGRYTADGYVVRAERGAHRVAYSIGCPTPKPEPEEE